MKQHFTQIFLVVLLIAVGVISRFVDLPNNFVAIGAISLISAYYLPSRLGWILPLSILFVSDLFIGFYQPFVMAAVYGSYVIMWGLGVFAKRFNSRSALLPATLAGSITFYVVTNFAVWAFSPLYSKTLAGLIQSYWMALPFFRSTLAGDLVYVVLLVAVFEAVKVMVKRESLEEVKVSIS